MVKKLVVIGLGLAMLLTLGCGEGESTTDMPKRGLLEGDVKATATLAPTAPPGKPAAPLASGEKPDAPRAADTPTAPAVAATAKPVATPLSVLASFTPQPVATRTPYPTATPISSVGSQVERDENVARCLHWALRNMEPIEFARFERLDPHDMSDLDRVLWGSVLADREQVQSIEAYYSRVNDDGVIEFKSDHLEWCQDYWSEALERGNATKRNHEYYLLECVSTLLKYGWDADRSARETFESYPDRERMSPVVVNQGVRLLKCRWMEMDGLDLLNSEVKPYEIVLRVWQSESDTRYKSSNRIGGYPVDSLSNEDKEWWGIEGLWNYDQMRDCKSYYPQLFFGRWVPLDSFDMEQVVDLDELLDEVRKWMVEERNSPMPDWFYDEQDRDILIMLERN